MTKVNVTEKGQIVLNFLAGEEIGEKFLGKEIAEGVFNISPRSITGILNSLYKNGLVDKDENVSPRQYLITDLGREVVEAGFDVKESTED